MKLNLWIYSQRINFANKNAPCNFEGERLLDLILEPYGEYLVHNYDLAPQLSIRVARAEPSQLVFVCNRDAIVKLPEGRTLKVTRNGKNIEPPQSILKTFNLTVKDHFEVIVTTGSVVETIHVIVVAITPDSQPQTGTPPIL